MYEMVASYRCHRAVPAVGCILAVVFWDWQWEFCWDSPGAPPAWPGSPPAPRFCFSLASLCTCNPSVPRLWLDERQRIFTAGNCCGFRC